MKSQNLRLEAVELSRRFDDVAAVDRLSLSVTEGEIYGLVGPDSAGKTTTLRMLAGLLTPSSGRVRLLGVDPLRSSKVRESFGYMPQQCSLYGDLTVSENLRFFSELFCLSRDAYEKRRQRLLSLTRLSDYRTRRADALSGGLYKKLALCCVLLHEPLVLLLDEPTNGVDPVSRREFWDLLQEFVAEGMTIVLATPYLDEAARCHRVGLLCDGRLLEEGRPVELLQAFRHTVFRASGDRRRLTDYAERNACVLASTPAGGELRLVVQKGAELTVQQGLAELGAQASRAVPTFEDLFLARVCERTRTLGGHL